MNPTDSIAVVATLLALQFTAFGWRITRELQMEDAGRRTWFPLPDYLNILCMLAVVLLVMVPLQADQHRTFHCLRDDRLSSDHNGGALSFVQHERQVGLR